MGTCSNTSMLFKPSTIISGLGLLAGQILAVSPTDCTVSNLWGTWSFNLGLRGNVEEVTSGIIKTDECAFNSLIAADICNYSNLGEITGTYEFEFSLYDVVKDVATGVEGTVTSIYNQGFLFDIYGQQWFVYWRFDEEGYYCDSSSVGFAKTHDNREYVRIQGTRISQVSETVSTEQKTVVERVNKPFSVEPEFIKKVNVAQPFWTAEHNIDNDKYTLLEHQSRGGQPVTTQRTKKSRNMAIMFMEAIENNERIHAELAEEKQSIPTNLDWRNHNGVNYVSPVDDQASCGSCYAFASAGLMESRVRVGTNNQHQPLFSEQEMITCGQDRTYNQGCAGGWDIFMAGMYGQDYGFVEEGCSDETSYNTDTYDNVACPDTTGCQRWYTDKFQYLGGYFGATEYDGGKAMMLALQDGPLGVGFEVYTDFRSYKTGVYVHSGVSSEWNPIVPTNHAVLCVGYGTCGGNGDALCGDDVPAGTPYFIGKNSWGTSFGQEGFFLILRGTNEAGWESMPFEATPIIPL